MKLYDFIAENEAQFCWFDPEELAQGRRLDGRLAYVDALLAHWGPDTLRRLSEVPDSAALAYLYTKDLDAIDIPIRINQPFRRGKTGKEGEVEVSLMEDELALLIAFAAHAKLPGSIDPSTSALLLPKGWVKLGTPELLQCARGLRAKLEVAGLWIFEIQHDTFYRISIDPEYIFFNGDAFSFGIEQCDDEGREFQFELRRAGFKSPLGMLRPSSARWRVTRNIQRIVEAIETGKDPEAEPRIKSGDIRKSLRDSLDKNAQQFGLRKIVREQNQIFELAIGRAN